MRGRLHTVRGKGKSAFLVLRQGGTGATVQGVLFVDDKTVSKVCTAPRARLLQVLARSDLLALALRLFGLKMICHMTVVMICVHLCCRAW